MQTAKYRRGEPVVYLGFNKERKGKQFTVFSSRWDSHMKQFYYALVDSDGKTTSQVIAEKNLASLKKGEDMTKFKPGDSVRSIGHHLYSLIGFALTIDSCVLPLKGNGRPLYGLRFPNGRRHGGLVAEELLVLIQPSVSYAKGTEVNLRERLEENQVVCDKHTGATYRVVRYEGCGNYAVEDIHTGALYVRHWAAVKPYEAAPVAPQKFPIDSGVYVGDDKETMWVIKEFLPDTREYRMTMFTHKAAAHDGFARESDLVLAVERSPIMYTEGDMIVPVTLPTQMMKVTSQHLWTVHAETEGGLKASYSTCQVRHATREEVEAWNLNKNPVGSCGGTSGRDTSHDDIWAMLAELVNAVCMSTSTNHYHVESIQRLRAMLDKHNK